MLAKRIFCLLFATVFLARISFPVFSTVSAEEDALNSDKKVYSNATLSDAFADNRILVVLNKTASLKFKDYLTSDFPQIACSKVTNLTKAMGDITKQKMAIRDEAVASGMLKQAEAYTEAVERFNQILCIELKEHSKAGVLEAISVLEKHKDVLYVGPDYEMTMAATANDVYYSQQWAHNKIQLPSAWNITTGSASVKVGVLDSGIDGTHVDLVNRIDTNLCRDFTSGTAVAVQPRDFRGHGTAVAGVIGAQGNNYIGVSGVCQNVTLVSLKVFPDIGDGYLSYVVDAIDFAEEKNIPILNHSGGAGSGNVTSDYVLGTVIQNYSGLLVCAAGNDGTDNDTMDIYPASYVLPNLISVGASTQTDEKRYDSNYGQETLSLFAPGESILTCVPRNMCESDNCVEESHFIDGYHYLSQTSLATPYVTGVAALLLSKYPRMSACEIKDSIMTGVDGCLSLLNYCESGGRLNAYGALTYRQQHTFTYLNRTATSHTRCCVECEHFSVQTHNNTYEEYSESEHRIRCIECNYSKLSPHNWSYSEIYCVDCFYVVENED